MAVAKVSGRRDDEDQGAHRRPGMDRRPPKLSEHLARQIVGDIVDEDLRTGDRLPAATVMAERYGVGTASLREALRLLEVSGLVYNKTGPGGGPVVADRSGAELARMIRLYFQTMGVTFRDVVNARCTLEPLLARQAAEHGDDSLREDLARSARELDVDDAQLFSVSARGFHDILATRAPTNPILGLFVRTVGEVYAEFVRSRGPRRLREDRPQVHHEHTAIAEAILAGDGAKAETLMAEHMADLADYLSEQYEVALDDVIRWA